MSTRVRLFAATAAALGWLALILQWLFSIQLSIEKGQSALAGTWIYFGFYTILTNILVALAFTACALGPRGSVTRFFNRPGTCTAVAMSIVVVSAVYNVMLRQLWHPQGWQLFADATLHDVMPLAFLAYWWFAVPKTAVSRRQIPAWLGYPAAYFAYALARGAVNHWYPYPFLDVTSLGYLQVVVNALLVLLFFIAVALALVALARWQARRAAQATAQPA
ncbi:Pr6Pr family membrane protein [Dyella sp. 2RAB6]|uniref:Pr6Pr family membrane protein n=1 Tax=Dyella sp. 2RAB6 TaxID=3232992 RepID=UPI003F9171C1